MKRWGVCGFVGIVACPSTKLSTSHPLFLLPQTPPIHAAPALPGRSRRRAARRHRRPPGLWSPPAALVAATRPHARGQRLYESAAIQVPLARRQRTGTRAVVSAHRQAGERRLSWAGRGPQAQHEAGTLLGGEGRDEEVGCVWVCRHRRVSLHKIVNLSPSLSPPPNTPHPRRRWWRRRGCAHSVSLPISPDCCMFPTPSAPQKGVSGPLSIGLAPAPLHTAALSLGAQSNMVRRHCCRPLFAAFLPTQSSHVSTRCWAYHPCCARAMTNSAGNTAPSYSPWDRTNPLPFCAWRPPSCRQTQCAAPSLHLF